MIATYEDSFREYAFNYGVEHPDKCWICTPWDTWVRNPAYIGPDQPHPEDDPEEG